MDWFLYDNGLRHERVKFDEIVTASYSSLNLCKASTWELPVEFDPI